MRRMLLIGLAMIAFVQLSPIQALACTCLDYPLRDAWRDAEAVFSGWIVSISPASETGYLDVEVHVTTVWKGVKTSTVHVYTWETEAGCGYTFLVGEEYLIFGDRATVVGNPPIWTHLCTYNRPMDSAQWIIDRLRPPLDGSVPVEGRSWGTLKSMYR
jgi:hypothetical protein